MKRAAILFLGLLAACGLVDEPDNPAMLAELPGIDAVSVALPDLPNATGFEYALSAAMGARDLPTYFGDERPRNSHRLTIVVQDGQLVLLLFNPAGEVLSAFEMPVPDSANKAELKKTADRIAEKVASILLPSLPVQAPVRTAHVAVVQGRDAPGDGDEALARAMTQMLVGKVAIDNAPSTENYAISVRVQRRSEDTREVVSLTWFLADPKGREIAHLTQSNAIAAGSLDHAWGAVAYDAALAAAQSLIPIIRKLPAEPPP